MDKYVFLEVLHGDCFLRKLGGEFLSQPRLVILGLVNAGKTPPAQRRRTIVTDCWGVKTTSGRLGGDR